MEPFYQEPMAIIYNGDALKVLGALPDESIQMCMTSPPYWGLRNYADGADMVWGDNHCQHEWTEETQGLQHENRNNLRDTQEEVVGKTGTAFIQKYDRLPAGICVKCGAWRGQLGLEPTPELYVEHLIQIFREVKRVLRKDGSFYLNIGDTYAAGGGTQVVQTKNASHGLAGYRHKTPMIPPKCMVCIPERVMFAMLEDGWILRNKIIWHKPNNMPSSKKSAFTPTWEYLYFFTKNNKVLLWRNRITGEWRETKPTKEENYPFGMRDEDGNKIMPLWMGFDYYFDLDSVRKPHLSTHPSSNKERKIPFTHKGNLGHSIPWQPFNLRVRDVVRGKGGVSAQGGELKASEKEVGEYEYPEKMPRHHGSEPQYKLTGLGRGQKHESADLGAQKPARTRHSGYFSEDGQPLVDFIKGKNPGDLWSVPTKPSAISVCPECDAVFPRLIKLCPYCKIEGIVGHFAPYPEVLCVDPIKASTKPGDTVLDPLAGGGTTGVAAKRLGREAILIDCVRAYCVMARYKLQMVGYQPELEYSFENEGVR